MTDSQAVESIREEVAPVITTADTMIVTNREQYTYASDYLKEVKAAQKTVKDHFEPMKKAAHSAWRTVCDREKEMLDPLDKAEKNVKQRMLAWYYEQERLREAEEARLRAEAEERARKERERLERQAAKLKTPELKEERLEQAEQIVPEVVSVQSQAPKIEGQSIRKTWKAHVADKKAAIQAIMSWPDWQAYITLNERELDRLAQRTKGTIEVDGVTFTEESQLTSRGK